MRFIYLYGPPAAGKLTIANEVSKLSGIKVFNNNLSSDLVWNLFGRYDGEWELINKIRFEIISEAAKRNIDLIFTSTYTKEGNGDDEDIRRIIDSIISNNSQIYFFQILCEKHELLKRIGNASRKKLIKLTNKEKFEELLQKEDYFSPIPFVNSIKIDTTKLSVEDSANIIIKYINQADKSL